MNTAEFPVGGGPFRPLSGVRNTACRGDTSQDKTRLVQHNCYHYLPARTPVLLLLSSTSTNPNAPGVSLIP